MNDERIQLEKSLANQEIKLKEDKENDVTEKVKDKKREYFFSCDCVSKTETLINNLMENKEENSDEFDNL